MAGGKLAKYQRVYKAGSDYYVEGVSERSRWLRFVGRAKIDGREYLVFRPVKKAAKLRSKAQ